MNDFVDATNQIRDAFKTPTSVAWARSTGRRDMANALLAAMRNARSQEQFDNLAYQFKRDVLMPYYREVVQPQGSKSQKDRFLERNTLMQMRPRKELGSYEELRRNPAFAQSRYKYLPRGSKDSVPQLVRIMQDPVESELAARELGMTPEDLRAYVQDRYNEQAREQFRKDMMAAAVEGQRYRDSLANDYADSYIGKFLNFMSPEVTGLRLNEIRTGKEASGWDMAKAVAKDALVGIGSLFTGGIAGKVVSNPIARAGLGGVFDAGLEAARQGMSDYYDWDLENIKNTGVVSATIPAGVGFLTSGLAGLPGGMRRILRPFRKKIYGMEADPAAAERLSRQNQHATMRDAVSAAESGDPLAKEVADDLLEESRDFIERSHANVGHEGPLTTDDLRDIVMDPERASKYFEPPTADQFRSAVESKRTKGAYDVVNLGGKDRLESDVAEEWLNRAKSQWPENYKKSSSTAVKEGPYDKYAGDLVDVLSREETARQRAAGKKLEGGSPSAALQQVMEYDPDIIRMWKAGFVPHDEAGKKLYDEWKKFGGQ